jgi:hypothetical protein
LATKSDLDRIFLVRHDEMLAKILHDTSLWFVMMDTLMSLSQVRNKIAEITCLKSEYVSDFTLNLIGDYNIANDFWVHIICIACNKLSCLRKYKSVHMLNHFDITSNNGIAYTSNSLIHD